MVSLKEVISAAVAIVGCIVGIVGMVMALRRNVRIDSKNDGKLISDIGYIKSGIDDLKNEQKSVSERHYALVERVTKMEARTEQAHERIDNLVQK